MSSKQNLDIVLSRKSIFLEIKTHAIDQRHLIPKKINSQNMILMLNFVSKRNGISLEIRIQGFDFKNVFDLAGENKTLKDLT